MGPSSPYYLFGAQRRYPYAWHGNAGGVPQPYRAATTRGLSNADMIESGYEPGVLPYVAFNHSVLHKELPEPISGFFGNVWDGLKDAASASVDAVRDIFGARTSSPPRRRGVGDWPLVRPAGPEPLDPNNDGLGFWDKLSDNEKYLVLFAGAGALAWFLVKRRRRRRNPSETSRARRARKLAALAQSSTNEHERALAAARAAELAPRRKRRTTRKRRAYSRRRTTRRRRISRRR